MTNVVAQAADGSGIEATCQVEVLGVTPSSLTLDKKALTLYGTGTVENLTEQLTATIKPDTAIALADNIIWTSADEQIVQVDDKGLVTVVGYGKTTVTAALADNSKRASCTVTAYPINKSLKLMAVNPDVRLQMYENDINSSATLVIKDSNGTIIAPELFTYTSSNSDVVVVKENGTVVPNPAYAGATDGEAVVTAALTGDLNKRKVTFNVSVVKLALNESKATLYVNGNDSTKNKQTITLSAEARNVNPVWISTDENVATVDEFGCVTAVGIGTTIVTATDNNGSGKFANCEITVRKKVEEIQGIDTITLQRGKAYAPILTVAPSDASDKQLVYSSSNEAVAVVDKKGRITAKSVGTTTIYVTNTESDVTNPISVTVEDRAISLIVVAVKVDDENTVNETSAMNPGDRIALQAAAYAKNTDGTQTLLTDRNYTWKSSNEKIATVDEGGIVRAIAKGTATITATATDGSGKKATQAVKVMGPVQGVTLNKDYVLMKAGATERLKATVLPANADNKTVTWSMTGAGISYFTINAKTGELKAKKDAPVGTQITVTATHAINTELKASCTVEIIGKPVTALTLNSKAVNLTGLGTEYELIPTFKPLDADEIAKSVVWSSTDEAVATVSDGLVRTCGYGKTTITAATQDGVRKAVCTVTVYPMNKDYKLSAETATQYIQIFEKDVNSICAVKVKNQFGTVLDETLFDYTSSNKQIAVVNELGQVTPNPAYIKDGTVTITATLKNDPAKRAVKFTVKLLKTAQTESIRISEKYEDGYRQTDSVTRTYTKGDVLEFRAVAYNSKDEVFAAKVKWTVSDASMAKVAVNKDGTVKVTIQKEGRFELLCTAQDTLKYAAAVSINTLSGTPKLSGNTLTLNQYETTGITSYFTIQESNGSEMMPEQSAITEVKLGKKILSSEECAKFRLIRNADATYALQVDSDYYTTLAKGSYAVTVNLAGDGIELLEENNEIIHDYPFKMTLKVVNTAPNVKISNPGINLFYQGADDRKQLISITAPAPVADIEAVPNQTNSFDDYFTFSCEPDGKCYVEFTGDNSYNKSSLKGKVQVTISGYGSVTKDITVSTPTKAPAFILGKAITLDANAGAEAVTTIINSATKEAYSDYEIVSDNNAKLEFSKVADGSLCIAFADGVTVKNGENLTATLQIKDADNTWKLPVSMTVKVKAYTTALPKAVTGTAAFTLNLAAPKESCSTSLLTDRSNVKITDDGEWTITIYDNATKTYIPCDDLIFAYNQTGDRMFVKLDPGTELQTGNYKVRIAGLIEGYEAVYKDITVTLINKDVKATIRTSGTIDLINRSQKYLTATVSLSNTVAAIQGVSLQSEDYYPILTGDKTFTIRLKQVSDEQTAKITLPVKLTLEGGTIVHTTVVFTPTQSTPSVKVPAAQTIYKSGKIDHVDFDLQENLIRNVKIDHITAVSVPKGFHVTSTEGKLTVHLTDKDIKPGTYSIKVNSYFVGAQSLFGYPDGKPVTSTITVKVTE